MSDYTKPEDDHLPEGEEAAPPLSGTMGIVRWIILGAISLFALVMVANYFGVTPWGQEDVAQAKYHCPMHPTYVSDQPGDCPICGMSLTLIKDDHSSPVSSKAHDAMSAPAISDSSTSSNPSTGAYVCPMHPEVVSDTLTRCVKCRMWLVKRDSPDVSDETPETVRDTIYVCPMIEDSEVVSDIPVDCRKCGMDLVPKEIKRERTYDESSHPSESERGQSSVTGATHSQAVSGRIAITLDPRHLGALGVTTATVRRGAIGDAIRAVGYIAPIDSFTTTVTARASGWVREVFVSQEGEPVEENQPLFRLYSPEIAQAAREYTAAQANAEKSGDSALVSLRNQMVTSARARLRNLGISEDDARLTQEDRTGEMTVLIRSPRSGVVIAKNIALGQQIVGGQALLVVANISSVWAEVDVFEKDIARVNRGNEVTVTADSRPGESFIGKIAFAPAVINGDSRAASTRVIVANVERKLSPGMFVTATIGGAERVALLIPREGLMDDGAEQFVYVVHDGTHFEPRRVTVGESRGDTIEIISGLSENERIVTSANFLIDSESRLKAALAGQSGGRKSVTEPTHQSHSPSVQ